MHDDVCGASVRSVTRLRGGPADRDGAERIVRSLTLALERIGQCGRCRMFSETEVCSICSDTRRDSGLVCIVETPADVIAIEESGVFRGRYFVLMGRLSPLDGIGPDQLGVPLLENRLGDGSIRAPVVRC